MSALLALPDKQIRSETVRQSYANRAGPVDRSFWCKFARGLNHCTLLASDVFYVQLSEPGVFHDSSAGA